jgi:hypothetical protein
MRKHNSHKEIFRSRHNHEEQKTINTKLIMEFDNLAYVSGPLSQLVRISYLCLKL